MKILIDVSKSFDDNTEYFKDWNEGALEKFLRQEGVYIDTLAKALEEGKSFTITYSINITK